MSTGLYEVYLQIDMLCNHKRMQANQTTIAILIMFAMFSAALVWPLFYYATHSAHYVSRPVCLSVCPVSAPVAETRSSRKPEIDKNVARATRTRGPVLT